MKKHFLDKVILRDLFWFIVLPYRLEQFARQNAQKKDWKIQWKERSGTTSILELHDKNYWEAKETAEFFGWTPVRWWQFYRSNDVFVSY